FNDVFTIVGVVMIIGYMSPKIGKIADPLQIIVSTLSIAIFLGIIGGVFWVKVLQQYKGKQFEYLLTIAFVFFLYSISEIYQGNGITSVLIFGLLLGNSDALARMFKMKEDLSLDPAITNFNNEISFFVRTMFFVYMGIILNLQEIDLNLMIIALLMFIAALAARYLAVKVLAWRNPQMADSELIITALMPRGLATAVLAALVADLAIDGINFPHISEIVVLFILFTNIFATIAVYYYETQLVPLNKKTVAAQTKK
ncbi:MAG: cation:proton antiporter, partial [Candidatus Micrarchaeota archaeon]